MQERVSLYSFTGLPAEFGYLALVFTFVLALAPYFASADFGVIKIPPLSPRLTSALKFVGPIAFLFIVFLYLPLVSARATNDIPDIAGTWIRRTNPPDMLRVTFTQSGKEVHAELTIAPDPLTSNDPSAAVADSIPTKESFSGRYIASEGYFEVAVLEHRPNCTQIMYGKLYPQSSDSFTLQFYAERGSCPPFGDPTKAQSAVQMYSRP